MDECMLKEALVRRMSKFKGGESMREASQQDNTPFQAGCQSESHDGFKAPLSHRAAP
jgi:hypothetical protein